MFVFSLLASLQAGETNPPCQFSMQLLQFEGTPLDQARCLLRPVHRYGRLGLPLKTLPQTLESRIGQRVSISVEQFRWYLTMRGISESELGGSLDKPLCRANDNHPAAPMAKYFIIHDTRTPNYGAREFPAQINSAAWEHNNLAHWDRGKRSVAHVFINRLGQSLTAVDFATPWRATKFELQRLGKTGKGLCLHVELIQPRRRDPHGPPGNDALAPEPGFTIPQLKRLALVYLAASIRKGTWLIPGYHAAIDTGIPDAHDDPQNFDLNLWAQLLAALVQEVKAAKSSRPFIPVKGISESNFWAVYDLGMKGSEHGPRLAWQASRQRCRWPPNRSTIEKKASTTLKTVDDTGFICDRGVRRYLEDPVHFFAHVEWILLNL